MKFLVDAQLPYRLVDLFRRAGLDTVHTLDLTLGNRTPDGVMNELSVDPAANCCDEGQGLC